MKKEKKEIMKKIGSIVVAGTILLGSNNIVLAKENNYVSANNIKQSTTNSQEEIEVYYNGERIEFDQKPILVNDRTLVPFRKVFESMGCIVYYNNSESKVMALTKEGDILTHTIGTNTFDLNGETKTFDSASTILNDRTLIPLRAVAETLSAEVEWNDKNQTVTIEKEESTLDETQREVINHVLDVNYNPKFTKRYVEYKRQHPELSIEQVIINVNMDLDKELAYVKGYGVGIYEGIMHYEAKEEDIEPIENLDDPYVYINKFRSIPRDYEPTNLIEHNYIPGEYIRFASEFNPVVIDSLNQLLQAADQTVGKIDIYRGYSDYERARLDFNGLLGATRYNPVGYQEIYAYDNFPQPDFSELRTGMSIIFYPGADSYEERMTDLASKGASTYSNESFYSVQGPKIQWLRENAYKYGFIERYPEDKSNITRYEGSTNFYRYVGIEIANQMHNENLCYDEYYAKYMNPIVNEHQYSIEEESTQKVLKKY